MRWFSLALALAMSACRCDAAPEPGAARAAADSTSSGPEHIAAGKSRVSLSAGPTARPLSPRSPAAARLAARERERGLDPAREYPRDSQGRTQCGQDMDCFVLRAKRCQPAQLEHKQRVSGMGLEQIVLSRYTLSPRSDEAHPCRLERRLLSVEARLAPQLASRMLADGKSDRDVEEVRLRAEQMLRLRNPPLLSCELTNDEALEVALDLAEGRYDPAYWRGRCKQPQPAPEPR